MISVDNISVRFGGFSLFENVSFMVNERDRIGLVGRNGAGKTTLLRIIAGEVVPSEGKVVKSNDSSIGYLPQQMKHQDGKTVYDEAMEAFSHILELEKKIERIAHQLEVRTNYESESYLKLIDDLSHENERFELLGGSSLHADVEKTLRGLGFESGDMDRPTSEFSGGWRMRIELAKILLNRPDFILLDEPTNHLDIESIQWLEEYLGSYPGAVILISHDKAFLDNITNRTIELSLGKIIDYNVSYSKYKLLRAERREQEMASYQNQQKMIRDTEEFIERFRYKATKAVQVQSRIKQLAKLDRIEVEDEDDSDINIRFPEVKRSGTIVVEADSLSKSFGDNEVLKDLSLQIERGEKVAFIGKNGEGKTTLSRIITGELDYSGKFRLGHNVTTGYFAQNQDEILDDNKTVFETIDAIAVGDVRTKIRDILGAFLFGGEDVDKKVKVLSGGERSRLSLAKLLLQSNNLLVMDEPTNHLDMRSKDMLKSALKDYNGTLIVVSHDREFLDGLVDKLYEFKDHKVKEYLGGIYDFLQKRKLESLNELNRKNQLNSQKSSNDSQNKVNFQKKKKIDREIRKAENNLHRIELEISGLEDKLSRMDQQLSNPENMDDQDLFQKYGALKEKIEEKMKKWENAQIDLERLKDERN